VADCPTSAHSDELTTAAEGGYGFIQKADGRFAFFHSEDAHRSGSKIRKGTRLDFEVLPERKVGDVGGVLVSPSNEFGESSDSQLIENLLASVSQHQRQKNGEQTVNRRQEPSKTLFGLVKLVFKDAWNAPPARR
jgi:cold shock CspA family protein